MRLLCYIYFGATREIVLWEFHFVTSHCAIVFISNVNVDQRQVIKRNKHVIQLHIAGVIL